MRNINLHNDISLVDGYIIVNNQDGNRLFLEHDLMYGGSDVYCWLMGFILIGLGSYEQILNRGLKNRSTRLGEFIYRLESELQKDINFKLNNSYEGLIIKSRLDKDLIVCETDKRFMSLFIVNHIELNNAVIIEFDVKGFDNTFSMLVTALEVVKKKSIKTLFCLSPQYSESPKNYWNAVFKSNDEKDPFLYTWVDFDHGESCRARIVNVLALYKIS
ncbi:hypothetical protein [Psychroserpens sp. S379A]|uniref:hypothetical protein n=1 Tax=Psychroserpens sp. S379A TaxID=3415137 RepID=UPI003C7BD2C3